MFALLGLVTGFLVFSQVSHSWVSPATERTACHIGGLVVGASVLLAVLVACFDQRNSAGAWRTQRVGWALCPLAGGIPLAIWQWLIWESGKSGSWNDGPWPLYAWMTLLVVCAWRAAVLIPPFEIRKASLGGLVITAVAVMVGLHVWMQYRAWNALSFGYHDIGLFARALFNAAHGRGMWVDSFGYSLLGEHSCFLLYLLVPLCAAGLNPFHLLVFTSAIVLNAPAFLVAWYLRRRLDSNLAALVGALAWLLLPSLGCLVIVRGYGFQAGSLAIPLLVAGLALTSLHRLRGATVCMLLAMLAREDFALTTAAWGVYVALFEKGRFAGTIVTLVAVAYFVAMIHVVIPGYRAEPYPWISAHFGWRDSISSLFGNLPGDSAFMVTLLLPMAILLVRPDPMLLIALPVLAETLLTTNPELHNLSAHYYTPAVPVLFFAALQSWARYANRRARLGHSVAPMPQRHAGRRLMQAGWCLLVAAWAGQTYLGLGPHTNTPPFHYSTEEFQASLTEVRNLRATVSRTHSVTASYRLAAHFLDFDNLWTVHNEQLGDLVIVDDRDNWDASEPRSVLPRAHASGEYQPVHADYHLVALIRTAELTPLARELRPDQVPADITPQPFEMGEGIELAGLSLNPDERLPDGRIAYRVTLIWRGVRPIVADYRFGLTLGEGRWRWGPFYFARGAYPTNTWEPGRLYRDDVRIVEPLFAAPYRLWQLQPVLLH